MGGSRFLLVLQLLCTTSQVKAAEEPSDAPWPNLARQRRREHSPSQRTLASSEVFPQGAVKSTELPAQNPLLMRREEFDRTGSADYDRLNYVNDEEEALNDYAQEDKRAGLCVAPLATQLAITTYCCGTAAGLSTADTSASLCSTTCSNNEQCQMWIFGSIACYLFSATTGVGPDGTLGGTVTSGYSSGYCNLPYPPSLQGRQGATGPAGPQGSVGVVGAVGPVGATGATGPVGETGVDGPVGPIGAIGNSANPPDMSSYLVLNYLVGAFVVCQLLVGGFIYAGHAVFLESFKKKSAPQVEETAVEEQMEDPGYN